MLPTQHPVAQVIAHAAGWQTPAWQTSVPGHALHCSPPTPQKPFWVPAAQMFPTQQPAVPPTPQFAGLHVVEGVHTPAVHVSFGLHAWHCAPFFPHAAGVGFATHWLPTQQPAQLASQDGGIWHVRSFGCPSGTQTRPCPAQFEHAKPPLPHAVSSVPTTHVVPTQQPPPHVSGPQVGVPSHRPPAPGSAVHVCPVLVQLWHCCPLAPQVVSSVPARHWLPTQQPLQFVASHRVALHVRVVVSHERPSSSQSAHARPPRPHACASVPERQRWRPSSKLQHPPGHDAGPQPGSSRPQTRLDVQTENPSAGQSAQRPPADPHARVSLPVRQMPAASQQPVGHVEALHGRGVITPPSESDSGSRLVRPHAKKTKSAAEETKSEKRRRSKEKRMRRTSRGQRSGTMPSPVAAKRPRRRASSQRNTYA